MKKEHSEYQEDLEYKKRSIIAAIDKKYQKEVNRKVGQIKQASARIKGDCICKLKANQAKMQQILSNEEIKKGKNYFIFPVEESEQEIRENQLKILKEYRDIEIIKEDSKSIYNIAINETEGFDVDINKIESPIVKDTLDIHTSTDCYFVPVKTKEKINALKLLGKILLVPAIIGALMFAISLLHSMAGVAEDVVLWGSLLATVVLGGIAFLSLIKADDLSYAAHKRITADSEKQREEISNYLSSYLRPIRKEYDAQIQHALAVLFQNQKALLDICTSITEAVASYANDNIPDTLINDTSALNDCIYALESGMAINYRGALVHANNQKNERVRKEVLDRMDARARRAYLEQQEMQEQQLRYQ